MNSGKSDYQILSELGYTIGRRLGSGMEGAVYELADSQVAKVWFGRTRDYLTRLRIMYNYLLDFDLPFATPRIYDIAEYGGTLVTVEQRLYGTPLDQAGQLHEPSQVMSRVVKVLQGLAMVPDSPALRAVPVVGSPNGLWNGASDWSAALLRLVDERLDRFGGQLRAVIPGFDEAYRQACSECVSIVPPPLRLLHGDLIPGNILVDADLRVLSVLDFGFLTTAGDPRFDAAVTAGVYDMYSPVSDSHMRSFDHQLVDTFGYSPRVLSLYRALYSMITSNVYDPAGNDGHFSWAVRQIRGYIESRS